MFTTPATPFQTNTPSLFKQNANTTNANSLNPNMGKAISSSTNLSFLGQNPNMSTNSFMTQNNANISNNKSFFNTTNTTNNTFFTQNTTNNTLSAQNPFFNIQFKPSKALNSSITKDKPAFVYSITQIKEYKDYSADEARARYLASQNNTSNTIGMAVLNNVAAGGGLFNNQNNMNMNNMNNNVNTNSLFDKSTNNSNNMSSLLMNNLNSTMNTNMNNTMNNISLNLGNNLINSNMNNMNSMNNMNTMNTMNTVPNLSNNLNLNLNNNIQQNPQGGLFPTGGNIWGNTPPQLQNYPPMPIPFSYTPYPYIQQRHPQSLLPVDFTPNMLVSSDTTPSTQPKKQQTRSQLATLSPEQLEQYLSSQYQPITPVNMHQFWLQALQYQKRLPQISRLQQEKKLFGFRDERPQVRTPYPEVSSFTEYRYRPLPKLDFSKRLDQDQYFSRSYNRENPYQFLQKENQEFGQKIQTKDKQEKRANTDGDKEDNPKKIHRQESAKQLEEPYFIFKSNRELSNKKSNQANARYDFSVPKPPPFLSAPTSAQKFRQIFSDQKLLGNTHEQIICRSNKPTKLVHRGLNDKLKPEDMPKCSKLSIQPSLFQLCKMTRSELRRVRNFKASNQYAEIKFIGTVNLIGKHIDKIISLKPSGFDVKRSQLQNTLPFIIKFFNFANLGDKKESAKDALIEKIEKWCDEGNVEVMNFCRNTGELEVKIHQ